MTHICVYCSKNFSNPGGLGSHRPYCKLNPDRTTRARSPRAGRQKGSSAWNKGLTNDLRCARPNQRGIRFGSSINGHSQETKDRLSDAAKRRKLGGYVQGSGRGKKGRYKGYWCDSSYELAWVIYNLDHGIPFERNTRKFDYEYEGKARKWIPDFILDGVYVEIKGYETDQVRAKFAAFREPLLILRKADLKPILDFVVDKYGRDYIRLYEAG